MFPAFGALSATSSVPWTSLRTRKVLSPDCLFIKDCMFLSNNDRNSGSVL